jgi:hypothetical protein
MGKTSRASERPTEKAGVTLKKKDKDTNYEKDLAIFTQLISQLKHTPLFKNHLGDTVQSVAHLSGCIELQDVKSIDDIKTLSTGETLPAGIEFFLRTTITYESGEYNNNNLNKLLILFKLIKKHRSEFMKIPPVESSSSKGGKTKKSRKSKNKTRRRKNKNISA